MSSGDRIFPYGQTEGWTDLTKLADVFAVLPTRIINAWNIHFLEQPVFKHSYLACGRWWCYRTWISWTVEEKCQRILLAASLPAYSLVLFIKYCSLSSYLRTDFNTLFQLQRLCSELVFPSFYTVLLFALWCMLTLFSTTSFGPVTRTVATTNLPGSQTQYVWGQMHLLLLWYYYY
jgi:hypothetical protein